MKQKYLFIFLTVLSAVFACEQLDESKLDKDNASVEEAKVEMTFTAVIEKDIDTKTLLVDSDNAGLKKVFWSPDDAIGVSNTTSYTYRDEWYGHWEEYSVSKFVASIDEPAASADFDGSAGFGDTFKAFYPYTETLRDSSGYFVFNLPMVQKYVAGSFDPNAAPMVATAAYGETFEFKNLCGIVAFNLTGTSAVKSIMFSGTDGNGVPVPVSGLFDVNPASSDLAIRQHSTFGYVQTSVTVDCVEPVQLNEAVPTTFYMMLPPATYADFSLIITTADGEIMMKSGKNLTITRSHLKPTGELEYVESEYVDLSAKGTSNSYIVEEAGLYSFKANVIGNGSYGYIQGTNFYPASPDISPKKVKLLWEDKPETVSSLALKDGRVNFMASGIEGNALIAVTDDSENILWSWHIWVTDQPQEQTYVNDKGTFHVLDRNIGATRADRGTGEEWRASRGLLYQWGRKDPFMQDIYPSKVNTALYMEEVIMMPTTFIAGSNPWLVSNDWNSSLWSSGTKTIYDPCPAGYRVAVKDIWYGFTKDGVNADRKIKINASGAFDHGWNFYHDANNNTTWYPATNRISYWGDVDWYENAGFMWHSNDGNSCLSFQYTSDIECYVRNINDNWIESHFGLPVRCMKDSGYEATSLPIITESECLEYAETSITMSCSVSDSGWGEVQDRGFIYSVNSDMTGAKTISCGPGTGEFSCVIDGLDTDSVYYIKAYATNSYGTSYSNVGRYRTMYTDGVTSLSNSQTANCYIVDPAPASYCFDAEIVGNGYSGYVSEADFYPQDPEIIPNSAELLWEDVSGIILDVIYQKGMVYFTTNGGEGNALIAVKDGTGKILWSWHIWVTDQPEGHTYRTSEGKVFVVMDRCLGSISSVIGDNGGALYYQWGRKDPFRFNGQSLITTFRSTFSNLSEAIASPMYYPTGEEWVSNQSTVLWSKDRKTIYDPCPAGWRVPGQEVWHGIRTLQDLDANGYGVVFGFYDSDSFWYPDTPRFDSSGNRDGDYTCDRTEFWTAEYGVSYYMNYNHNYSQGRSKCDAQPVRCMKDE